MIERKRYVTDVGGKTLTLEVSSLAEQANAAVLAHYGGTVVLATVVMGRADAAVDYLPLKVDYEERFYAAGKIIGSRFIRREGRPSEEAVLAGRLVDRTIRPLFDHRIRREIQVVLTVLAYDEENDPDFVGLIAASTALMISDIPWSGPASGVRIARIGKDLAVNPEASRMRREDFGFETFLAGPRGKVNMIEMSAREVSEDEALEAFEAGAREIDALADFQERIAKEIGKPKVAIEFAEPDPSLRAAVEEFLAPRLESAVFLAGKVERNTAIAETKRELFARLTEDGHADLRVAEYLFEEAIDALVHRNALEKGIRADGRGLEEIRPLSAEVDLFDRTHGSAIFLRGLTQALAVTTLAPPGAEQMIETMEVTGKRRFMLHYNFPPYSTGEVGRFGAPGRREIGHGALAEKAIRPLLPTQEEFPYTIRVVSEMLSSNGSTSMATVCASTLSLMDAGVPIKKPVAGIAMGLMASEERGAGSEERAYKILTDLQGVEDFYGDMDFKVAGTEDGVTAIQLDTKIYGISSEIIRATLAQAKRARLEILQFMKTVLPAPRKELSKYVPCIEQLTIDQTKIGLVIGPGGKTINGLIAKHGLASIDIEEDGRVFVAAHDPASVKNAVSEIRNMTREFRVGEIIEGPVVKILDFGAIVDLGGGQDGMIHVSELKNGFVKTVGEVLKIGDVVRVKVIRADADGRIGLSLKQAEGMATPRTS